MQPKSVQKSFRFTPEVNKKLEEIVTMMRIDTRHFNPDVTEEVLAILTQTYVITLMINGMHFDLLKELHALGYDLSEHGIDSPLDADDDLPF